MTHTGGPHDRSTRTIVVGLAFTTAAAGAVVELVKGPAGSGYGWGATVVSAVIVAIPLVVIGLAVRSADPRFAWVTMALAAALGVFVLLALVGNWSGQTARDNALDSAVAALALATIVGTWAEEIPLLKRPAR